MPRGVSIPMGLMFEKDWKDARNKFGKLDPMIRRAWKDASKKVATQYYHLVKGHLKAQDIPGWQKLSKSRQRARLRRGYTANQPLLASKTYLRNIRMYEEANTWSVGIRKGIRHPESKKLRLDQIAALHEVLSYRGGPFRGLWKYTYLARGIRGLGGNSGYLKTMKTLMKEYLNKRGYRAT